MEKDSLLDDASVLAWIADHEPDGRQKLLEAIELGQIREGPRAAFVRLYFQRETAVAAQAAAADEAQLARRNVVAAERSAQAAVDSAAGARASAKWAFWAVVIALAALLLAAWPYISVAA